MRLVKRLLLACLCVALLGGAVVEGMNFANRDNSPVRLWGTDATTFTTVATNGETILEYGSPKKIDYPTRTNPVFIAVQVERLYGLHLGTPVKVRYVVTALNSIPVNFETVLNGVLSRYKTTWRLYDKPVVVSETSKAGFTTRTIDMVVAVWEPPAPPEQARDQAMDPASAAAGVNQPQAQAAPAKPAQPELWPFTAEILYSVEKMDNGLAKWEYIEGPEVKFGFSSLIEPGAAEYDLGPLGDAPDHLNPAGMALIAFGALMVLGGVTYLYATLVNWLRRRRIPRPLPAEVAKYRADMAEAELSRNRPSLLHLKRVAVRDFLGSANLSDAELAQLWVGHPLHDRIVRMLAVLEDAVKHGDLTAYEESVVDKVMQELLDLQLAASAPPVRLPKLKARLQAFGRAGSKVTGRGGA